MNAQSRDPESLRQRMQAIRGELSGDISGVLGQARDLTDWKYHVRKHPWACTAAAAAAGYLFIPRRKEIVSPDAKALANLARQDRLVVERAPKAKSRGGIADMLVAPLAAMLMRAASNYISVKLGEVLHAKSQEAERQDERQADDPTGSYHRPR